MGHLSLINIIKTLFFGGFLDKSEARPDQDEDHKYVPGDITTRGPCPGLNALANQGYLFVYPPGLLK